MFNKEVLERMNQATDKCIEHYNSLLEVCEVFHKKTEILDLQQTSSLYERLLFLKNYLQSQKQLPEKLDEINGQWLKFQEQYTTLRQSYETALREKENAVKEKDELVEKNEELEKKVHSLSVLLSHQNTPRNE